MTERTVRGVTVDLDDTLFDQQAWLDGAWAAVGERAGQLGLDGAALTALLRSVAAEGSDRGGIVDRALTALGVHPAPYVGELVEAFRSHAPTQLPAYPGALEALDRLGTTVPVVVITDGDPQIQHAKIAALGVARLVAFVVVSDELGGRELRKPHPVPFQRALGLLGLPAAQVVHVGDRPAKDVAGAASVGMRCVRVRTGEYAGLADPAGLLPWRSAATFAEAVSQLGPDLLPIWEQPGVSARL